MTKKLLSWIFFLCCFVHLPLFPEDVSKQNKPFTVRVLLTKLSDEATIEIRGRYHIYNPKTDTLIATGPHKKKTRIFSTDKGLVWGDTFSNLFELRLVPLDPRGKILVNGISYKGCVEIYGIGGTINIVNEVDTEHYLKSMLTSKTYEKIGGEALDAIAITERTNLYYILQKTSYASWQVEGEKVGYVGVPLKQSTPIQEAVERTRNMILNHKKQPFSTAWALNHAGRSVSYGSVFRKKGQAPSGVESLPSNALREKAKWKSSIPKKVLANLVGLSTIQDIDLFRAEKSSKVYALRICGPEGKKDFDFFTFQSGLGPSILPSNDFKIFLKGKKIFFVGHGKGAGVGLCAASADLMAKRKENVKNILLHHFPETQLVNVREEAGLSPMTNSIWK